MPDSEVSIVLEVLEAVDRQDLLEAVRCALPPSTRIGGLASFLSFLWDANVHDNEALDSEVLQTSELGTSSEGLARASIQGEQTATKFNEPAGQAKSITVRLAVWRIPSKGIDLTLVVYQPPGCNAGRVFERAVQSLRIRDMNLFA